MVSFVVICSIFFSKILYFLEIIRPQSEHIPYPVLNNIYETVKRTQEEKRRLDMESKLYKKWRNGFSVNYILLDSKSEHEALAKMNWLDKQVSFCILNLLDLTNLGKSP